MNLKDRKKQILKIIINNYIDYGVPIGSKAVVDNLEHKLSTATIRNEMAALEEMGYLVQPHISSGRVPSDLAYRFYVDALMDNEKLSKKEVENIHKIFNKECDNVKQMIGDAVKVLSDLTNCVAIAVLPKHSNVMVESVRLLKITEDRALVVIVTNHGIINDRVIKVDERLKQQDLDILSNHISTVVRQEKSIDNINLIDYIGTLCIGQDLVNQLTKALKQALTQREDNEIIVGGAINVFDFPEYKEAHKAKQMMQSLEDKDMLTSVILGANQDITIGAETNVEAIKGCSVISAKYSLGENETGTFAIIGPKRMKYSKMLKILEVIKKNLEYQNIND